MLSGLCDLTSAWAQKENLVVTLDYKANIRNIVADERRIKQVVLNLIQNAINFTPDGGKITVGAKESENFLVLYVSDTGVGISKEDQKRIFDPFERIPSERIDMSIESLEKGAGLGLSLVKNIVELHGGYVDVRSKKGDGTTFYVYLPTQSELESIL